MKSVADQFIKVHSILNAPGNPVLEAWINVRYIVQFGPSSEEYAKIGAGSIIQIVSGQCLYCTEHAMDLVEALHKSEVSE